MHYILLAIILDIKYATSDDTFLKILVYNRDYFPNIRYTVTFFCLIRN